MLNSRQPIGGGGGGAALPITTRGDLVRGGVGGVAERYGLGANGTSLTSNGTDAVWAAVGPVPVTPDLTSGTITNNAGLTGVGAPGSFVGSIPVGSVNGYTRCTTPWSLGGSRVWSITARVTFDVNDPTHWVDVGVRYSDNWTVVAQLDSTGGANARTRGGGSQGSLASGSFPSPCFVQLLVDHGRITAAIATSASGPWTTLAEGTGLVRFSGMDPAITSLFLAVNTSGVAGGNRTVTIDQIQVTDLDF